MYQWLRGGLLAKTLLPVHRRASCITKLPKYRKSNLNTNKRSLFRLISLFFLLKISLFMQLLTKCTKQLKNSCFALSFLKYYIFYLFVYLVLCLFVSVFVCLVCKLQSKQSLFLFQYWTSAFVGYLLTTILKRLILCHAGNARVNWRPPEQGMRK